MNANRSQDPRLLEAFIKSVQYVGGLKTQQDVRDHLGQFVTEYLPAEWVAFTRGGRGADMVIDHCTLEESVVRDTLASEVGPIVLDVMGSGFLACEVTHPGETPSMTAFLPVIEDSRGHGVMLVGHASADPLPRELLDIYLALAGLAGTTLERLGSEIELARHRTHLEELVGERTFELRQANEQLTLEIAERVAAEQALHAERERLSITLRSIGDGVIATDTESRVVLLNGVAEEMTGWTLDEAAGRPVGEVFEIINEQTRMPAEIPIGEALSTGRVVELANHTLLIARDGSELAIADSCAPIKSPDGTITGAVLVFRDVTEQYRSERLRDALNQINTAISSSLDVDAIMLAVVEKAVQALGCENAIVQFSDDAGWEISHASHDAAAVVGQRFRFDEARWLDESQLPNPIALEGTRLHEMLPNRLLASLGAESIVFMPVAIRGEVVAALGFVNPGPLSAFTETELDFVRKLSASLSMALENARLYEAERQIAQTLQEALICIPQVLPGMELGHHYHSATKAAKVGGDFYDVFQIQPGKIGVLMGDVAGHGLSAATLTLLVQNTMRAFAHQGYSPSEVMSKTNDIICEETETAVFVTVFFGVLEMERGRLTYCSGGHPPALMRRADGEIELLHTACPIVGAFRGLPFGQVETQMAIGEMLVLYTDGVTEARDATGEFFGHDRLVAVIEGQAAAPETTRRVFERVFEFTGGALNDDVAILSLSTIRE